MPAGQLGGAWRAILFSLWKFFSLEAPFPISCSPPAFRAWRLSRPFPGRASARTLRARISRKSSALPPSALEEPAPGPCRGQPGGALSLVGGALAQGVWPSPPTPAEALRRVPRVRGPSLRLPAASVSGLRPRENSPIFMSRSWPEGFREKFRADIQTSYQRGSRDVGPAGSKCYPRLSIFISQKKLGRSSRGLGEQLLDARLAGRKRCKKMSAPRSLFLKSSFPSQFPSR